MVIFFYLVSILYYFLKMLVYGVWIICDELILVLIIRVRNGLLLGKYFWVRWLSRWDFVFMEYLYVWF